MGTNKKAHLKKKMRKSKRSCLTRRTMKKMTKILKSGMYMIEMWMIHILSWSTATVAQSRKVSKRFIATANVQMPFWSWSKYYSFILNFYSYGFCYGDNRYDSHIVRVKLNANVHNDLNEEGYDILLPHLANAEEMLCSEEIRLKFDSLNLSN